MGANALVVIINETELDSYFESCTQSLELVDNSSCSANATTNLIECVGNQLELKIEQELTTHNYVEVDIETLKTQLRSGIKKYSGEFFAIFVLGLKRVSLLMVVRAV